MARYTGLCKGKERMYLRSEPRKFVVQLSGFILEPLSTEEMEKFTGRIFSDKNVDLNF